jgi:haloacetate dehalogenase
MTAFEDFQTRHVPAGEANVFVRIGGAGPPLLLLHGFPQTHLCWARIAGPLSEHFTLILADLTGYGQSEGPPPAHDGANYAKREVAKHMVTVMRTLGFERFALAGHDRGGRVSYRLALDHPECVTRLGVLSILPTFAMWRRLADVKKAINTYHWFLLAQPPPIAGDLLAGAPRQHVRNTIASWTKSQTLEAFSEEELETYGGALSRRAVIDAVCAEYRAGWNFDGVADEQDITRGHRIGCPTLVLWGSDEYAEADMRAAWSEIAMDVTLAPVDCGHFVTEEAAQQTLRAMIDFFQR